ncbi:protein LIKE EARLY STARVATION, chloroplastic [Silene latifolia]|uniref:protein LIKE EARLY STARVATION, chloroplastic n=1 Tax=Silene latifolia TaxID=37657 RepID=UPI003D77546A
MAFPLFSLPVNLIRPAQFTRARVNASVNAGGDSYLGMWKKAVEREKKAQADFLKIAQKESSSQLETPEVLEKKTHEFQKILQVSKEERDRVQRIQVIDRAAAAIAAARALLKDTKSNNKPTNAAVSVGETAPQIPAGTTSGGFENSQSRASEKESPGPDFWSWTPPTVDDSTRFDTSSPQRAPKISASLLPVNDVMEKESPVDFLSIPFERELSQTKDVALPPFQSFMEVHEVEEALSSTQESPAPKEEIGAQFSSHAAKAAGALHNVDAKPSYGINANGSRWWKETGVETRADGVVCRWTLNRGVTADGVVEWEEKYWEAADEFAYKELGSEKSGRDAMGNVWHEYWKESMWQEQDLLHMEKTADKWGKNGKGDEWQEKWFEHYDASGKTEKWAHKWCSIDPITEVEVGHGHVWNERWGEKYDGEGGSIKYTDKWAERYEGDGWVKWGDKWDEHFDQNGHGVKQGETWWQGKYGEQWNRTWGEQHNGTGWVHKYGKSSSGEHWDTHAQEDTWYEKYPHFGFMHCLINSVQLREVPKPSESETS